MGPPSGGPGKKLRQAQENLRLDRVVASPYPAPQLGIDLPLPSVSVGSPLFLFLDDWKFITREQSVLNLLYHGINGSFCRYRKALYFWSLGISLYLELFCFLSFITIVLRNLCSGTHRRNRINLSSYSKPLLNTNLLPFLMPEASSRREHLSTEVFYMLGKGTIERVANKFCPGFYSLLFVTPSRSLTYGL